MILMFSPFLMGEVFFLGALTWSSSSLTAKIGLMVFKEAKDFGLGFFLGEGNSMF